MALDVEAKIVEADVEAPPLLFLLLLVLLWLLLFSLAGLCFSVGGAGGMRLLATLTSESCFDVAMFALTRELCCCSLPPLPPYLRYLLPL